MGFQIQPLPAEAFQHLFDLSAEALSAQRACKMVVTETPGTPCRVSMADAEIGETVVLVNYTHQKAQSPYHASHAVYVRQGVPTATLAKNEVPRVLVSRLISLRGFDSDHMIQEAEVVQGSDLSEAISKVFENEAVAYIHLHYAKPGCFAASVHRAA